MIIPKQKSKYFINTTLRPDQIQNTKYKRFDTHIIRLFLRFNVYYNIRYRKLNKGNRTNVLEECPCIHYSTSLQSGKVHRDRSREVPDLIQKPLEDSEKQQALSFTLRLIKLHTKLLKGRWNTRELTERHLGGCEQEQQRTLGTKRQSK